MSDLSVIIPARNEMFLSQTIEDLLKNIRGDTEIICVCDGNWPYPPVKNHPKVTLVYHSKSIGQRAAMNEAVKLSRAKYIMKVDAHCAFDEGFDIKMMADIQDDWTMVPVMRNLHVFDWVCEKGHRRYQGPSGPCRECGGPTRRDVVWIPKTNPQSTSYCFDPEPHFQYFGQFKSRPEGKGDLTETMSLQGSCFMATREKYWELDLCDETFGSWGSQGLEVAIKTWLSGGRVICNHKTWYAHCFRTQGGDFGFPYPISGRQVARAKKHARDLFFNNKWPKQKYALSWLVEKFWPVPHWKEDDLKALKEADKFVPSPTNEFRIEVSGFGNSIVSAKPQSEISKELDRLACSPFALSEKGVVFYTDSRLDQKIAQAVRTQIKRCCNGHEIVSVSLKPLNFGRNITMQLERSYLTMFKEILAGLEASTADIIFLCEHDVLYHPCHFEFIPPKRDVFYYNENRWFVDAENGRTLFYNAKSTSQLCAYRDLLVQHYRKRVERVEKEGFTLRLGFEPGNHPYPRGVDFYRSEAWMSEIPNIDIRHRRNLTPSRWSKDQFRNKRNLYAWTESDSVPGWGKMIEGGFQRILEGVLIEDHRGEL